MSWIIRSLMLLMVLAACVAGWSAGGTVTKDLTLDDQSSSGSRSPSSVVGPALQARVSEALAVVNARRESRKDGSEGNIVFLERVSFERSAGGVVARGSVQDLGAPRTINAVVDAFDGTRAYLASASSPVSTTSGSTAFSVFLQDSDAYQSFSVRFLNASMEEIVMRSSDTPAKKVAPLLVDDPLHAFDMAEVADRLVSLGYAEKAQPVRDEIVAAALIGRFRKDVGFDGPSGVTVGDLLALRVAGGSSSRQADLADY